MNRNVANEINDRDGLAGVGWRAPRWLDHCVTMAVALAVLAPVSIAQEEPQQVQHQAVGALVTVPLPIPGGDAEVVKTKLRRSIDRLNELGKADPDQSRPVLIVQLLPTGNSEFGQSCSFESAFSLARFLSSDTAAVQTVAYIPETIKGHGVLIAMACQRIVMAPDAEIGEAGIAEKTATIDAPIVDFYRHIARKRRTVPEALALGMLDPALEVLKVETEGDSQIVLAQQLEELKETHTVGDVETIISAGSMGSFSGREAKRLNIADYLANDADAVAAALRLPPSALIEDQAALGQWRPVYVEINGEVTARKARQISTMLAENRDRHGMNWFGVRITSSGGDIEACLRIAETIARQDATDVRTVAYVPVEASGGAAIIALACDHVFVKPDAVLGGDTFAPVSSEVLPSVVSTLQSSLAPKTKHPWSLLAAFIDPHQEIIPYRHRTSGRTRYMSTSQRDLLEDADDWQKAGDPIQRAGQPLKLTSEQALDLGVAQQVLNPEDIDQIFGFEESPQTIKPNWALELVEALAAPGFAILLLVIGFVGLYIELQAPGIGFGGFIATVAFMLFFWSKFLDNTAGWLEVILLVGGIVFLLLEWTVLPGFGIFGLGGGLMIIASLILASQTFIIPHSAREMDQLREALMVVAVAGVGTVAAAVTLRRFLPHTPMFNKLLLAPPDAAERDDIAYREFVADFSSLLGKQGVATTDLRPSGRADIDGELIDVIAQSSVIDRGTTVEVVFAKANRVLVRPVEDQLDQTLPYRS